LTNEYLLRDKKDLTFKGGAMKNVMKFLIEADDFEIIARTQQECDKRGIDIEKIEPALFNMMLEPDIKTMDYMIVQKILGG